MRRLAAFAIAAMVVAAGAPARAGETRCWIDHGVVVAPAAVGDIAGDFILDLSAPTSQLHQTVTQGAGLDATDVTSPLRFGGEAAPAEFEVADLDARGWGFPTNIAGVIGADLLARYALELRLFPCRVSLWAGRPPHGPSPAITLPLTMVAGVPTVTSTISDGRNSLTGAFAIDTGSAGVRISDAIARLSPARPGVDAGSRTAPPALLAGLELGGVVFSRLPAGLEAQTPPGLIGSLGDDVWSRYAWVRINLAAGRLELGPHCTAASGGPRSATPACSWRRARRRRG